MRPLRKASIAALRDCAVTPAFESALPASVFFSIARASKRRSTVTKLSPAFSAAFSAAAKTRASWGVRYTWPAPPPPTLGSLSSASSAARSARRGSPPAREMSPDGKPLAILDQDLEKMLGRELLMTLAQRERLRRLDESLGAIGVFFDVHVQPFQPAPDASAEHARHRRLQMWCGTTTRQGRTPRGTSAMT